MHKFKFWRLFSRVDDIRHGASTIRIRIGWKVQGLENVSVRGYRGIIKNITEEETGALVDQS